MYSQISNVGYISIQKQTCIIIRSRKHVTPESTGPTLPGTEDLPERTLATATTYVPPVSL